MWTIYNGNIEVVVFVIDSGRKIIMGQMSRNMANEAAHSNR